MLPIDEIGRRAVDETLADWHHEAGEATTTGRRMLAALHGALGIAIVLGSVTTRDLGSLRTLRQVGASVGLAMLIGLPFFALPVAAYMVQSGVPALTALGLMATLIPAALTATLPLALLTPPMARPGGMSLVGAGLLIAVLSAVNLGWVAPNANQHFRETAFSILNPSPSSSTPRRGDAELTVAHLMRDMRQGGPPAIRAVNVLTERAMPLAMVPVCLLIGTQARRFVRARRWQRGAGRLAWGVTLAGTVLATVGVNAAIALVARTEPATWQLPAAYRPVLVPLVCLFGAVALAWSAHRTETRTRLVATT
jgi:hypothetical protein